MATIEDWIASMNIGPGGLFGAAPAPSGGLMPRRRPPMTPEERAMAQLRLQQDQAQLEYQPGGTIWMAAVIAMQKGLPIPTNMTEAQAILSGNPVNWQGTGTPPPGGTGTPPPGGGGTPPPPPPTGGGGLGTPPPGSTYTPTSGGGGTPGNPYAGITSLLPGYGVSQSLKGFGIPGFETNPLFGGGSFAGTTFLPNDAPAPRPPAPPPTGDGGGGGGGGTGQTATQVWGWVEVPGSTEGAPSTWKPVLGGGQHGIPAEPGTATYEDLKMKMIGAQADYIYQSQGGSYQSIVNDLMANDKWLNNTQITSGGMTTPTPGSGQFGITKAQNYTSLPFNQTYGGKQAPFANIHEQIGASMQGVPVAYPGFAWAGPGAMAAAQPSATGMPPGGWTQMLGFTPGTPTNYGFIGGRPNPYGITGAPLAVNPTIG